MAEKIVSPGVFTNEIDASFLPAAIGEIGAALVGPTAKGPSMVPTVVSSYGEFQAIFGDQIKSGSNTYQYLTSMAAHNYLSAGNKLTVVRILDGAVAQSTGSVPKEGAVGNATPSFVLSSIGHGNGLNTLSGSVLTGSADANGELYSGTNDNFRWEISTVNETKGTFTLLIRRGNDTTTQKVPLETWNDLNLDPNSNNYIARKIGNQNASIAGDATDGFYINYDGDYQQKSKYVYVKSVDLPTPNYLTEGGEIRLNAQSASLPDVGSGSLQGAFGGGSDGYSGFDAYGNLTGTRTATKVNFFGDIDNTDSQGYELDADDDGHSSYIEALNLLANADEYDINLLFLPGIIAEYHSSIVTKAIDICESRGDCFFVFDPVGKGENSMGGVTDQAKAQNSNYAATYWPWVQVIDLTDGKMRWVPATTMLGGVFAFNDKVAAPWFAPAGLNRGGLDTVIQAARKLTHGNRDTLYESNVNPLATFPGQGVVVWGQKTLQKKASALDRVNVRRLLIKVKKFIASSSRFLVFEQNNTATRERFLNIANPFLESVQSQSGLNAFKVVMDDTNNTPDVVDRNILYGQIFLQPTKTAEFIILDFTIQPTGAAFPE
jgi:hypothetical protein